jgi:3-phosphoshikimate 1-carboxyvinyltransferase
MARGVSRLRRPLLSDDTRHLMAALTAIGIGARPLRDSDLDIVEVDATSGPRAPGAALHVGNAGTAMRFLCARLAAERQEFVLDGDARMRQRPIGDLVAALGALGAAAESVHGDGCPPVRVGGRGLPGGHATLAGERSSQFLSALLLSGPAAERGLDIEIEGRLVSRPYVDMTLDVMRRFGARASPDPPSGRAARFTVAPGQAYRPADLTIEGDYSSASYFFAAAAIVPGRVEVGGLAPGSLQGDARFLDLLEEMGCAVYRGGDDGPAVEGTSRLRGLEADLGDCPDMAPTLAVVALFAEGETRIRGVPHLRLKESDRIAALCEAIGRLGGEAQPLADGLVVRPGPLSGALIDPREDHRIAMAFAIAGLRVPGVRILDPSCVSKSYPGFWDDLDRLLAGS